MDEILEYIKRAYSPLSVILYGSYADGSNQSSSDFDALVISKDHAFFHDTSVVCGIRLDVFVYPTSYFEAEFDCGELIQIFDGKILLDTAGRGENLQKQVLSYLEQRPRKTDEEIKDQISWCRKMLIRAQRSDAEGMFRWHWLLTDSLEIFCDAVGHAYFGPKKALKWMETAYPQEFACYKAALFELSEKSLQSWIGCLERMI